MAASSCQSAVTSSLPLMGIGNLPARSDAPCSHCLITPHGDRKHNIRHAGDPLELELITPHGDRKPSVVLLPSAKVSVSLPLMGIGNLPRNLGRFVIIKPSLPLMGIGNGAGVCRFAVP